MQVDIYKRQSIKDLIRKTTGLSELTEEALGKLGSGDEALRSEVATLQDKLGVSILEREGLEGKHTNEINGMRMSDTLRGMGVGSDKESMHRVHNNEAFNAVSAKMLDGAIYKDGAFVYQEKDGATIFGQGGKPLTPTERLAQLREDPTIYQFVGTHGGGGGKGDKPDTNIKSKIGTKAESFASTFK